MKKILFIVGLAMALAACSDPEEKKAEKAEPHEWDTLDIKF